MCSINSVIRCLCILLHFSVLVFQAVFSYHRYEISIVYISTILPFYVHHPRFLATIAAVLQLRPLERLRLLEGDRLVSLVSRPLSLFFCFFFFFYSPSFSQPLYDGWVQCIDHCRTNHCQTGRFSSFSVYSTFEIVCRNTLKPHQETPHTGLQLCTVREDRHAT